MIGLILYILLEGNVMKVFSDGRYCVFSGARVIMACRDLTRGEAAATEIRSSTGNTNVVVQQLNLASLGSVRQFAREFIATETRLDILINNAGESISFIYPTCFESLNCVGVVIEDPPLIYSMFFVVKVVGLIFI